MVGNGVVEEGVGVSSEAVRKIAEETLYLMGRLDSLVETHSSMAVVSAFSATICKMAIDSATNPSGFVSAYVSALLSTWESTVAKSTPKLDARVEGVTE